MVYGLGTPWCMLASPVDASTSWGDGAYCKLGPVNLNPRLGFSEFHSWCLFPRDLLQASGTSLMSLACQGEGEEERKGWGFAGEMQTFEEKIPLKSGIYGFACKCADFHSSWDDCKGMSHLGHLGWCLPATALKTFHCHAWGKCVLLQEQCQTFLSSNVIVSHAGKGMELN